jgi:hypothetical protein
MKNVNSKFSFLVVFIAFFLAVLPVLLVFISFISPKASVILPILFMLFIVYFWLTEFRTRVCKLIINKENIVLRRYFGLGKSEIYDFKRLDGFITSFQSGKTGVFEFLFMLENGKRVGCVSSFYHCNYDELKEVLKEKMIDLGDEKYEFKKEYSEMFK